jgi:hypothetical protein
VPAEIILYLQDLIINTSHMQKFANISCLLQLPTLGSHMTPEAGVVPHERCLFGEKVINVSFDLLFPFTQYSLM